MKEEFNQSMGRGSGYSKGYGTGQRELDTRPSSLPDINAPRSARRGIVMVDKPDPFSPAIHGSGDNEEVNAMISTQKARNMPPPNTYYPAFRPRFANYYGDAKSITNVRPVSASSQAFLAHSESTETGVMTDVDVQAAPTPWTRYYFEGFRDTAPAEGVRTFYKHFDVKVQTLNEALGRLGLVRSAEDIEIFRTNFAHTHKHGVLHTLSQTLLEQHKRETIYYREAWEGEQEISIEDDNGMENAWCKYSSFNVEEVDIEEFLEWVLRLRPSGPEHAGAVAKLLQGVVYHLTESHLRFFSSKVMAVNVRMKETLNEFDSFRSDRERLQLLDKTLASNADLERELEALKIRMEEEAKLASEREMELTMEAKRMLSSHKSKVSQLQSEHASYVAMTNQRLIEVAREGEDNLTAFKNEVLPAMKEELDKKTKEISKVRFRTAGESAKLMMMRGLCSNYEAKIDSLNNELIDMKDQIVELSNLSSDQAQAKKMKITIDKIKKAVSSTSIETLKAQLLEQEKEYRESIEKEANLRQEQIMEYDSVKAELIAAEQEIERLKKEILSSKGSSSEIEIKLKSAIEDAVNTKQREIDDLIEMHREALAALRSELEDKATKALDAKQSELDAKAKQLKSMREKSGDDAHNIEIELMSVQERLEAVTATKEELEGLIAEMQAKLDAAMSELNDSTEEKLAMQTIIAQLEANSAVGAVTTSAATSEQVQKQEAPEQVSGQGPSNDSADMLSIRKEMDALKKKCAELTSQMNAKQAHIDRLAAGQPPGVSQASKFQEDFDALMRKNAELSSEISAKQAHIDRLEAGQPPDVLQASKLQEDFDALMRKNAELSSEMSAKQAHIDRLEAGQSVDAPGVSKLQEDFDALMRKNAELMSIMSAKQAHIDRLETGQPPDVLEASKLQEELVNLRSELNRVRIELESKCDCDDISSNILKKSNEVISQIQRGENVQERLLSEIEQLQKSQNNFSLEFAENQSTSQNVTEVSSVADGSGERRTTTRTSTRTEMRTRSDTTTHTDVSHKHKTKLVQNKILLQMVQSLMESGLGNSRQDAPQPSHPAGAAESTNVGALTTVQALVFKQRIQMQREEIAALKDELSTSRAMNDRLKAEADALRYQLASVSGVAVTEIKVGLTGDEAYEQASDFISDILNQKNMQRHRIEKLLSGKDFTRILSEVKALKRPPPIVASVFCALFLIVGDDFPPYGFMRPWLQCVPPMLWKHIVNNIAMNISDARRTQSQMRLTDRIKNFDASETWLTDANIWGTVMGDTGLYRIQLIESFTDELNPTQVSRNNKAVALVYEWIEIVLDIRSLITHKAEATRVAEDMILKGKDLESLDMAAITAALLVATRTKMRQAAGKVLLGVKIKG